MYSVTGSICTFHCQLADFHPNPNAAVSANIEVKSTTDSDLFINAAATGFHSGGRLFEVLTVLAQSAANRPDTTLYVAKIDGRLVGTAAMGWIVSSLPHARGKDVHRALVEARLIAAKMCRVRNSHCYGPSRKRECAKY